MNFQSFKKGFDLVWFNEFYHSEEDLLIEKVAKQYVLETELYDRTVCTGPVIENSIRPASYTEIGLCSQNARKVFKRLVLENNVDSKKLLKAIQRMQ